MSQETVWRVPVPMIALKAGAAAAFAAMALFSSDDPPFALLAAVAAVGLAVFALRDVLARERLAAGPDGVRVTTGFAGHTVLPWARVQAIRVDERRRLLHRSRLLEIDTGDDLHVFSTYDLGADVVDAAGELERLRDGTG